MAQTCTYTSIKWRGYERGSQTKVIWPPPALSKFGYHNCWELEWSKGEWFVSTMIVDQSIDML